MTILQDRLTAKPMDILEKLAISTSLYLFKNKLIKQGKWKSDTNESNKLNYLKGIKKDIEFELSLIK